MTVHAQASCGPSRLRKRSSAVWERHLAMYRINTEWYRSPESFTGIARCERTIVTGSQEDCRRSVAVWPASHDGHSLRSDPKNGVQHVNFEWTNATGRGLEKKKHVEAIHDNGDKGGEAPLNPIYGRRDWLENIVDE